MPSAAAGQEQPGRQGRALSAVQLGGSASERRRGRRPSAQGDEPTAGGVAAARVSRGRGAEQCADTASAKVSRQAALGQRVAQAAIPESPPALVGDGSRSGARHLLGRRSGAQRRSKTAARSTGDGSPRLVFDPFRRHACGRRFATTRLGEFDRGRTRTSDTGGDTSAGSDAGSRRRRCGRCDCDACNT